MHTAYIGTSGNTRLRVYISFTFGQCVCVSREGTFRFGKLANKIIMHVRVGTRPYAALALSTHTRRHHNVPAVGNYNALFGAFVCN